MATRRSTSQARRRRVHKTRSTEHVYGVPVPEGLHEAIETERSNLSKAESVLGCLAISMEYEADSEDKPYYPDVAQLARELVRQSINGLDSLVLQQRLLRNKVKESHGPPRIEGAYPVLHPIDFMHLGGFVPRRAARGLANHFLIRAAPSLVAQ
jgi:hypothetical protein